ncbi:MAG TPA: caspase family protein, partial [Pyrinomonadaceae bacterium]
IFYSGHGEYGADGDYYLTTHDTTLDSKYKVEKGAGISDTDLIDHLRQIPAKRLILILNACHSGAVSPSLDLDEPKKLFGSVPAPENSLNAVLSTGEGRIIITACRPEQKSWIGNGTTTIFANSLIEGLSGGGYVVNNNGYVSAFSLYEHIFLRVKESAQKLGQLQESELSILKNVGPFPVAIYRGATSLGDFANEPVPADTATREVDPGLSDRMFKRYANKIGFLQIGWTVHGDVKQAGRDFYDGTSKTRKDEGSE